MSWDMLAIGDFCRTGSGGTPSRKKASRYFGGTIPWVKSGELREGVITETEETITELAVIESNAKFIPKGALLVAMYGATIGRVAKLGIDATSNQAVCHILPDESLADMQYMFYALQAQVPHWLGKGVGGAQPNISQEIIKNTVLPLPPLEEQRRIAAILDKANQLRQLSQGNLQSLGDLLRKVFSDMFGDPVANERGWNSGCIGDFVAQFETGKSLGSGDGDASDSLRIIRVSAVSSGSFKPEESKPAPKGYVPRENYFVKEGDLLFCRANTDMLIGEVAYVGQGVRDLLLSDRIWRFCWSNNSKSHALYVQQLFRHPSVRREIRRRATGTSGSMLNISQSSVLEIPIILPPADLQNKFQDIAAECRRLFLQNTRQAISLRLLSCSLNRSLLEN
jgi:type I restriction enzyme S subunit